MSNYPPGSNIPSQPPDYGQPPEYGEPPRPPQRVLVQAKTVRPVMTYIIIGVTVFVFLLQMLSEALLQGNDIPVNLGVKVNSLIVQGQWWRLFTPMLLHASILHIGVNMFSLYNIGPALERHYGHWRYLVLYVLCGFTGNVLSFLLSPSASLGASTSIFGLLGAFGIFLFQNRKIFGESARRMLTQIIFLAVLNLLIGLTPGIDDWGHLGGLIGGVLFAWFAGPIFKVEGIYPNFTLLDEREEISTWLAGLGVGLLFALLAAVSIFNQLR